MAATECITCGRPTPSKRAKYCDVCRPSKHKSRSTVVFGKKFASAKEAKRYGELLGLAEAGRITGLKVQPRYPIAVNGHHICAYVADFCYCENGDQPVVEDVKSKWTAKMPVYRLKVKLMRAVHGIVVREVIR